MTASLLQAAGCPDPRRRARYLVAWCDGILANATVGPGAHRPPTRRELAEQVDLMLAALLDPAQRES
ncbi:hypothetical protein ACFQZC_04460 [Streptacidiphilus monticola]